MGAHQHTSLLGNFGSLRVHHDLIAQLHLDPLRPRLQPLAKPLLVIQIPSRFSKVPLAHPSHLGSQLHQVILQLHHFILCNIMVQPVPHPRHFLFLKPLPRLFPLPHLHHQTFWIGHCLFLHVCIFQHL